MFHTVSTHGTLLVVVKFFFSFFAFGKNDIMLHIVDFVGIN